MKLSKYFFSTNYNKNKGFTLIELLVVIAIIGVLSSVVLSSLNSARAKGRDASRISQLKEVQKALELYYFKYGKYPYGNSDPINTENGRRNSCNNSGTSTSEPLGEWDNVINLLIAEGFIPSIPRDPQNTGYGTTFSKCFKYGSYTSASQYRKCGTTALITPDIDIKDYGYVLLFSSEGSTFKFPRFYWGDSAKYNGTYQYCLLGPRK